MVKKLLGTSEDFVTYGLAIGYWTFVISFLSLSFSLFLPRLSAQIFSKGGKRRKIALALSLFFFCFLLDFCYTFSGFLLFTRYFIPLDLISFHFFPVFSHFLYILFTQKSKNFFKGLDFHIWFRFLFGSLHSISPLYDPFPYYMLFPSLSLYPFLLLYYI